MVTCKNCRQHVDCYKIGGQYFILCKSKSCSGTASAGSPLSNGKATEAEAWAQARAERKVEG